MFAAAVQSTDSPTSSLSRPAVGQRQSVTNQEVSAVPQALTDAELELHIESCGKHAEDAMARWEAYGDFADRGEAGYWTRLMVQAINSRSASQVARMEAARGLA